MKLLIIAGPYEADRIRKASLAAGFETVAVEPGESLSGWITASRPELIVMAPQIVHPDPALALAKVRAVPRGRVPIFLVGDEADEARMRDLADGFFVRPVAPSLLLERARAILSPGRAAGTGSRRGDAPSERTEMGLGPLPAVPSTAPAPGSGGIHAENEFSRGGRTPKSGPHGPQGARPTLKPLTAMATTAATAAAGAASPGRADSNALMAELDAGIDALFDAELTAAVSTPARPQKSGPIAATGQVPLRPPTKAAVRTERQPPASAKPDFEDETTKKVQAGLLGAALQAVGGERTRARLLERYAPVEAGDYFAVLGVSRDAGPEELRRAHAGLVREIAPDVVGPQLADELTAQIDAIRQVAAEALRVLSDDRLRPRYTAHLPAHSAGQKPGSPLGQLRK
jgi:hypothetical protein